jgi:hypothetical protein
MDCIPAALVKTNWEALAAWAGALVSCIVVWSAFAVAQHQRDHDRAARNSALRLVSTNGLRSVIETIRAMNRTVSFCGTESNDHTQFADDLEREIRVVDFFLSQPMPDYGTLQFLVEIGADAKSMLAKLKSWPLTPRDRLFNPDVRLDILVWAERRSARWSRIEADAFSQVETILAEVRRDERALGQR